MRVLPVALVVAFSCPVPTMCFSRSSFVPTTKFRLEMRTRATSSHEEVQMVVDKASANQESNEGCSSLSMTEDTTTLGTLQVPSVGIGTISWSSDKRKLSLHATKFTLHYLTIEAFTSFRYESLFNRKQGTRVIGQDRMACQCSLFRYR